MRASPAYSHRLFVRATGNAASTEKPARSRNMTSTRSRSSRIRWSFRDRYVLVPPKVGLSSSGHVGGQAAHQRHSITEARQGRGERGPAYVRCPDASCADPHRVRPGAPRWEQLPHGRPGVRMVVYEIAALALLVTAAGWAVATEERRHRGLQRGVTHDSIEERSDEMGSGDPAGAAGGSCHGRENATRGIDGQVRDSRLCICMRRDEQLGVEPEARG